MQKREPCPDCGRMVGRATGCFQAGGDPIAIRELMTGPLSKRCPLETGPDGSRFTIYLTVEKKAAARGRRA